jgi:hypothetical protein
MVNLKGSENAFCVQAALPEKSVRTINFGSAAGCEARLCRAVSNLRDFWAVPPVRPLASEKAGKARTGGTAPFLSIYHNGGAEPRLTSGGRAASSESKTLFGQSEFKL